MKKGGSLKLKLFKIVEESAKVLKENYKHYEKAEKDVVDFLVGLVSDSEVYIGSTSRIKSEDSLKSKIVRKKYYLDYESGSEIIEHLSDIVGVTLECRFKEDEVRLLKKIKEGFIDDDKEFSQAKTDPSIYLNLKMSQPQKQKNGFDDYRIDGYCYQNGKKVNFELQIKSLINTFWSGIEHEVIYKNNNYLLFDNFLKEMLTSIKSNLETVDYQLTKIYGQMTQIDNNVTGMDGENFKPFLGKSINDLFSVKLKETIDIEANIKKISALLSQYIYIEDFVRSEVPQVVMMNYFEQLNLLSNSDMDFTVPIIINEEISNGDLFTKNFGQYCLDVMNVDFDWHVLFSMLFMLQKDDVIIKFDNFIKFIKEILFSPLWFQEQFKELNNYVEYDTFNEDLYELVAKTLIKQKTIEIIYEENLYDVMIIIRNAIAKLISAAKSSPNQFNINKEQIFSEIEFKIDKLFTNNK